ncbi:MAG: hemerythrin domain-containing protein [Bradymonadales bacterium]|nr:hemerythrin domain-containing protein [Bradymonadales bacterium]
MGQPDAIIELKGENHLLLDLTHEVENLVELMRDLSGPPDEEIIDDLLDATNLLNVRMRALFEEEERLIYPAVRACLGNQGKLLKSCLAEHNDLKLSLTTLAKVTDQLELQWKPSYIEQIWAVVDHIAEVYEQHIECEKPLFDRIAGQLTLMEHRDLVTSLRRRRTLRMPAS